MLGWGLQLPPVLKDLCVGHLFGDTAPILSHHQEKNVDSSVWRKQEGEATSVPSGDLGPPLLRSLSPQERFYGWGPGLQLGRRLGQVDEKPSQALHSGPLPTTTTGFQGPMLKTYHANPQNLPPRPSVSPSFPSPPTCTISPCQSHGWLRSRPWFPSGHHERGWPVWGSHR